MDGLSGVPSGAVLPDIVISESPEKAARKHIDAKAFAVIPR